MKTALRSVLLATMLAASACAGAVEASLRYLQPAADTAAGWEREALPIGNGRLGGMLFGEVAREHLQFNEITLWTGDDRNMGAYQPFGDVLVELAGHEGSAQAYRRELLLDQGLHRITYKLGGISFQRDAFASHPAGVIVMRLTADRPGQYTGKLRLTDMHAAKIAAAGTRLQATGSLRNGLRYASLLRVLPEGGSARVQGDALEFSGCDAMTIVLGAGTSYLPDASRRFLGADPLPRVSAQVTAAAAQAYPTLLAAHQKDYRGLFDRVQLDLGTSAPERRALPSPPTPPKARTPSSRPCTSSTAATC
jgi:alpha-L-fucosidase 2